MKKLFLIYNPKIQGNRNSLKLLTDAAEELGVESVAVDIFKFQFSKPPRLNPGDGLYRIASAVLAQRVERFLVKEHTSTFYQSLYHCLGKLDNVVEANILLEKTDLPVIKSAYGLTSNLKQLKNYVQFLGGFPVVLKGQHGSHGVGVIKLDSWEGLKSLVDYLDKASLLDSFILRQFIPHKKQARLVVVGDQVVAAHINHIAGDFRSNRPADNKRGREAAVFPDNLNQLAIKAVHVLGWEAGGVDLLFHQETDKPYLAEVNLPFYFAGTQEVSGVNIAWRMVKYLLKKAKS